MLITPISLGQGVSVYLSIEHRCRPAEALF